MLSGKDRQVGSVLSFIVVAAILLVATVGVITFVQQRAEQVRRDEATKIADQQTQQPNSADGTSTEATQTTDPEPSASVASNDTLPATGVEQDVLSVIALGVLTATIISYVQSRRLLKSAF